MNNYSLHGCSAVARYLSDLHQIINLKYLIDFLYFCTIFYHIA